MITGGFANGSSSISYGGKNFFNDYGGGMYHAFSSPSIVNTVFSGNSTTTFGGGMYNTNSSLSVVNTMFSGNSGGIIGGGMYE